MCLKCVGTVTLGSMMLLAAVVLGDKGLTPVPQRDPPPDAAMAARIRELEHALAQRNNDLADAAKLIAARENAIRELKITCEQLMRYTVIPPVRGPVPTDPDLIPRQNVPTCPLERRP